MGDPIWWPDPGQINVLVEAPDGFSLFPSYGRNEEWPLLEGWSSPEAEDLLTFCGCPRLSPDHRLSGAQRTLFWVIWKVQQSPLPPLILSNPEQSLHPYAIRMLLNWLWRQVRDPSTDEILRPGILLHTHSVVLLNCMDPEEVWVRSAGKKEPAVLTSLFDPTWLACFRIGDLYAQGEFAGPHPER